VLAPVLALAAVLPAVWWEPLHVDESFTLTMAPRSFGYIIHEVFFRRADAPAYSLIEHATLSWPGGIEALRLPAVLFFLVALPGAGLVARELAGRTEALVLPLALALAPLAVRLADFGRPYTLLLALVVWSTYAALKAAKSGSLAAWSAIGALAGALVYVHSIGPLYLGPILLTGLLHSAASRRRLAVEAATALGAALLVGVAYYLNVLTTLRDKFGAYRGAAALHTSPQTSVSVLAIGDRPGLVVFGLLAVAGLAWLARSRTRTAVALAAWVAVPIGFFWLVPVERVHFSPRYMIAVEPFFLLLVVVGALSLGRVLPRPLLAGGLVVAALLAWLAYDDVQRLRELHGVAVNRAAAAVSPYRDQGVLFASTGEPVGDSGRSPGLVSAYITLELPGLEWVRERRVEKVTAFVRSDGPPKIGLWLFMATPSRIQRGLDTLAAYEDVEAKRLSPHLLFVRSVAARDPATLVKEAYRVRTLWLATRPSDRRVRRILAVDQAALDAVAGP
jgi:4-amino-4-deoxy-L-arabinose transferase-like glycosyltransferase